MNTFLHRILGKMYALKIVFKIALTVYFNNEFVKKRMLYLRQNNSHNMVPLYFIHRRSLGPVQLFWVFRKPTQCCQQWPVIICGWAVSLCVSTDWHSQCYRITVCLPVWVLHWFSRVVPHHDYSKQRRCSGLSVETHSSFMRALAVFNTCNRVFGVILLIIFGLCCCDLHTSLNLCRFL